ncbi:MAG: efflux RND transporter permease subunit [Betaproteobacteria bacterium]|nr:efflux RND transporter permease subunit [Betaproteobacteria bacterium]
MRLSQICIERPVFSTVLSLVLVLLGLVSFDRLTIREYPKIDEPVVTVSTNYRGASPEIIESQVTKPLEDSIAGIEGVEVLTSISRSERSQITVRFNLSRDPDSAASDVRDRVSRVRSRLPDGVDESVVAKVEADAQPIIWLTLNSPKLSLMELSDIGNRLVKPRLQNLPGAADVTIFGDRRYAMRIWLDRDRLAAQRVTVQDVEDALRRQNVEIPAGRVETPGREFSVMAPTDLQTPQEFAAIVLRAPQGTGALVRLGDVARVQIAPQDERRVARFRGRTTVAMGVIKQATANPLTLSQAVTDAVPSIQRDLPPDVSIEIANDNSIFIDRSIRAVAKTITEAVILVALVVFIFLRSLRASIIPIVTIPVSLISAFTILFALDYSINTLTMLALVLAIGLVVDDAIVVLENSAHHVEQGMSPEQAASRSMKEISFAVVAMTLTLAAVFAPMAFSEGRTGRLFTEFAMAMAGAVLISGFVALTLTPMMCSRLLQSPQTLQAKRAARPGLAWAHQAGDWFERGFQGVVTAYDHFLPGLLHRRKTVLLGVGLVVALGIGLFGTIKKELSPFEDRGFFVVPLSAPEGSSIDYTARYALRIEKTFEAVPEADKYFVIAGTPTVERGIAFFRPVPWEDRSRSTQQIAASLQPQLLSIPGINAFAVPPPSFGQNIRSRPIQVVVLSTAPIEQLAAVTEQLRRELIQNPMLQGVETDLQLNKPEIRIEIDRERAADLGVQVESIGRTLESLLGGRQVTRFKKGNEQYDVIVQLERRDRDTPQDIRDIYVRGRNGAPVALSSVLKFSESVSPRELNHFLQQRAVTITAGLAPGVSIGEALSMVEALAREKLPADYQLDYDGQSREYRESQSTLLFVFVLALVFIFLVLSAQFESFLHPLVILVAVPLALTGALFTIWVTKGSLNVYSQIGLVALIGLIAKNGILIVEFANQLRAQGLEVYQATHRAAVRRFRPILMTTIATVSGALPLALATGPGAESRREIGWVVVGGMSLGTLLTLFVLPTIYAWVVSRVSSSSIPKPLA